MGTRPELRVLARAFRSSSACAGVWTERSQEPLARLHGVEARSNPAPAERRPSLRALQRRFLRLPLPAFYRSANTRTVRDTAAARISAGSANRIACTRNGAATA